MSDELLDPERELISLQRFAKMIDTPEKTIRLWLRLGYNDLHGYKMGKRWKFKVADIRKWYAKMKINPKAA